MEGLPPYPSFPSSQFSFSVAIFLQPWLFWLTLPSYLTPLIPQMPQLYPSNCLTFFLLLVIICVHDRLAEEAIGGDKEKAGAEYSQQADGAPQGNHWDQITPSPPLPSDRRHPSSWSPWALAQGLSQVFPSWRGLVTSLPGLCDIMWVHLTLCSAPHLWAGTQGRKG